jgi:hypothetical protein
MILHSGFVVERLPHNVTRIFHTGDYNFGDSGIQGVMELLPAFNVAKTIDAIRKSFNDVAVITADATASTTSDGVVATLQSIGVVGLDVSQNSLAVGGVVVIGRSPIGVFFGGKGLCKKVYVKQKSRGPIHHCKTCGSGFNIVE